MIYNLDYHIQTNLKPNNEMKKNIQGVLALCYFWDLEKIRISQKSH